jgi:hypothetical protein
MLRCESLRWSLMNFEMSDDDLELMIKALEHYYAYTVATKSEDARYKELAHRLKRKPSERAGAEAPHERARTGRA